MTDGQTGRLGGIPVRVEGGPEVASYANMAPLLHEVRHALRRLLESGEETTIDLRGLPLGPAEEEGLLDALGTGEIEAHLDALGKSEVRETGYPGVWVVSHFNPEGRLVAKLLEVTYLPAILASQREDVQGGLVRLEERLRAE